MRVHSLGLDRIMLDFLISVILLLWNRLRMSDKFFNFFSSFIFFNLGQKRYFQCNNKFISIFLDFETCTTYFAGEVLQFYTRYYMYQENLSPHRHGISSPENTSHISPLWNNFWWYLKNCQLRHVIWRGISFKENFERDKPYLIFHYYQCSRLRYKWALWEMVSISVNFHFLCFVVIKIQTYYYLE